MQTLDLADMSADAATVVEHKLVAFCHHLRSHGFKVTAAHLIDIFRALPAIDVFQREDLYTLLEANLVAHAHDLALFRQLFTEFWRGPAWAMTSDPCLPTWEEACAPPPPPAWTMPRAVGWDVRPDLTAEESPQSLTLYSPHDVLTQKDFGTMAPQELRRVQRLIMTMARQMATRVSRRQSARAPARRLDPGRTLRHSLRYGGEVVDLAYRGPRRSKTKMVVLCDVSGSMDVYSTFLLQFLYGMQNGLRGVETLVFGTHLTRITPLLRRRHIDAALRLIADTVHDWAGGTTIGACLHTFNTTMAAEMVTAKTLVVIMSDGWDTGDTAVLDGAMAYLRRQALRVVWLNPLLGSRDYQPLCKGIQTALPYVHDFLPVHNVESLRQFGRLVARLV